MEDLFAREQQILDDVIMHLNEVNCGAPFEISKFKTLVKEYGRILRQLRRVTKISDKTTVDLNASKLDLLEKVHLDSLTGIYNRRFLFETLDRIINSISRTGGLLSVLMIDIDYFKRYNDTYGHSMGDDCLRAVAKALNESITRSNDFAARYGGEEFVIVLPETGIDGACLIANRVLEKVKACNIPHIQNDAANCVTVSVGATTGSVDYTHNFKDYIERADKALYMSKHNGRNRFTYLDLKEGAKR